MWVSRSPSPPHPRPALGSRRVCAALQSDASAPCRYFNCSSPGVRACGLPASCCLEPQDAGASVNDQCGFGALRLPEDIAQTAVHLGGCGAPLRQWLRVQARAMGSFVVAVVLVQGAELLLAMQLLRALAVRPWARTPAKQDWG